MPSDQNRPIPRSSCGVILFRLGPRALMLMIIGHCLCNCNCNRVCHCLALIRAPAATFVAPNLYLQAIIETFRKQQQVARANRSRVNTRDAHSIDTDKPPCLPTCLEGPPFFPPPPLRATHPALCCGPLIARARACRPSGDRRRKNTSFRRKFLIEIWARASILEWDAQTKVFQQIRNATNRLREHEHSRALEGWRQFGLPPRVPLLLHATE